MEIKLRKRAIRGVKFVALLVCGLIAAAIDDSSRPRGSRVWEAGGWKARFWTRVAPLWRPPQ